MFYLIEKAPTSLQKNQTISQKHRNPTTTCQQPIREGSTKQTKNTS